MLKQIFLRIAEAIAYNTKDIVSLITLIVWLLYTKNWISNDSSPAVLVIFFAVILYLPVFYAVFYILMLIPKFICFIILQIIYAKARYKNNKDDEFEHFWKEQNQAYDDIEREQKEREEKERQNEQAWQNSYESWKKTYERYRSQQEESYQKAYNQSGSQYEHNTSGPQKDELHDALSFYGLSMPFTQDQLREKRRKLMKTAHPDEGGDTEAAADINRYFDILKKYAN